MVMTPFAVCISMVSFGLFSDYAEACTLSFISMALAFMLPVFGISLMDDEETDLRRSRPHVLPLLIAIILAWLVWDATFSSAVEVCDTVSVFSYDDKPVRSLDHPLPRSLRHEVKDGCTNTPDSKLRRVYDFFFDSQRSDKVL